MKLKDLITDQNRALYQQISNHLPVQLKRSNDGLWSASLEDRRVLITYAPTPHPQAAFTHELLHVETELMGYRRLRAGVSLNHAMREQLPFLCVVVDNGFQHYKMYPRFVELGYSPHDFYQEADALTEQYVLRGIEAKGQSLTSIGSVYFMLIGAGGVIPVERVLELKERFRNYDEGAFRERFDAIDKIVAAWTADAGVNAEPYIVELMNLLGCADAWLSYVPNSTNFPGDGFFTGRPFTLEDLQAVWGAGDEEDL
jgi:hypothetical protein